MSGFKRIRANSRASTVVMGVHGDYDPARAKRNADKRKALEDQDKTARLARAEAPIIEAIAMQALAIIKTAGGSSTYAVVCAAIERGADALSLAYLRGWIIPAINRGKPVRGSCKLTRKGRDKLARACK